MITLQLLLCRLFFFFFVTSASCPVWCRWPDKRSMTENWCLRLFLSLSLPHTHSHIYVQSADTHEGKTGEKREGPGAVTMIEEAMMWHEWRWPHSFCETTNSLHYTAQSIPKRAQPKEYIGRRRRRRKPFQYGSHPSCGPGYNRDSCNIAIITHTTATATATAAIWSSYIYATNTQHNLPSLRLSPSSSSSLSISTNDNVIERKWPGTSPSPHKAQKTKRWHSQDVLKMI